MAPEVLEAVISKDWQLPGNGQGTGQCRVTEGESASVLGEGIYYGACQAGRRRVSGSGFPEEDRYTESFLRINRPSTSSPPLRLKGNYGGMKGSFVRS